MNEMSFVALVNLAWLFLLSLKVTPSTFFIMSVAFIIFLSRCAVENIVFFQKHKDLSYTLEALSGQTKLRQHFMDPSSSQPPNFFSKKKISTAPSGPKVH